jgi:hypothetical protein
MKLRIEVPEVLLYTALDVARVFASDFPDRVGRRHGVVYSVGTGGCLGNVYAYRTRGGEIVVRSA